MRAFLNDKDHGKQELALKKDTINPNLIDGSASFDKFSDASGGIPQVNDAKYQGLKVVDQSNRQWKGFGPYIFVQAGTYTFSFYAKTSGLGVKSIMLPLNTGLDDKDKQSAAVNTQTMVILSVSDWSRFDCTFVVNEAGYIHPRIESSGNNDVLLLAGFKLEKGSIATPWCPSMNDLATGLLDIQAIKSKIFFGGGKV